MSWNRARAKERIQNELMHAPQIKMKKYFDEYLPIYEANIKLMSEKGEKTTPPLVNLKKGEAVFVDTVQIYINLINFNDYLLSEGKETEISHKKALEFLHLYYSACDRVIEKSEAQRVDFHGARLHMVVLDDTGKGIGEPTIARALRLVKQFEYLAKKANEELGSSGYPVKIRAGIDAGLCVAINNGTGNEQEPMFLGSSANHAAKLAEGDEEGIYISPRVCEKIHYNEYTSFDDRVLLSDDNVARVLNSNRVVEFGRHLNENYETFAETLLSDWRADIEKKAFNDTTDAEFQFFYKTPPLSDLDFGKLMPSNTARLPLASIFADISGYTSYIDSCIESGDVEDAVKALYVIRSEFKNVVEKDFDGRKIRFIGDCIQGVLAEGGDSSVDSEKTAHSVILCCGGLRSSFNLCLEELGNTAELGLSIGVEFGETPITRSGIRGERSVRIACSSATAASEELQSSCQENETRLGESITNFLPVGISDLFYNNGVSKVPLYYDDIAAGTASPAVIKDIVGSVTSERAFSSHLINVYKAKFVLI